MTRINVIDPQLLTDQHAMAEYRELPMVIASLKRSIASKKGLDLTRIPAKYTLNSGHVMFHYDKGLYLFNRYNALINELINRGYNINPAEREVDWTVFHSRPGLYRDWVPDHEAIIINCERLIERINQKLSWYRYYRKPIDVDFIDKYRRGPGSVPL